MFHSSIPSITPNPKNCIYILFTLHHDPFTRREKTRAMRARIPSPQGGEEEETGEKQEKELAQLHKGGEEEESAPDKNLIVVHGRCCCCRGGSFHTTTHHVANDSWKGEWKGRASSKLQLCRNYRAERIAGRRMRLLGGRGGVRRGSWPPFHRIRPWPPPLRDDNISWTNLDSARHLSLSLTLSIYLNFFPNLFLFLSLSLYSSLFCRAKSISRSRFIRSVPYSPDFSALEEGGGDRFVVTRCPENSIFERADTPSSSDFLLFLLIIF